MNMFSTVTAAGRERRICRSWQQIDGSKRAFLQKKPINHASVRSNTITTCSSSPACYPGPSSQIAIIAGQLSDLLHDKPAATSLTCSRTSRRLSDLLPDTDGQRPPLRPAPRQAAASQICGTADELLPSRPRSPAYCASPRSRGQRGGRGGCAGALGFGGGARAREDQRARAPLLGGLYGLGVVDAGGAHAAKAATLACRTPRTACGKNLWRRVLDASTGEAAGGHGCRGRRWARQFR
jgi:hypothetical protein